MAIGDVSAYKKQTTIDGSNSVIAFDEANRPTHGNHCELTSGYIFAVWNDVTLSLGKCKVGTRVSDYCIEWGAEYTFNTGNTSNIIATRVSDTQVLITYTDVGNSSHGTAILATVTGTEVALGTKLAFNAATSTPIGATLLDTNKVAIAFANSTTNGQAVICNIAAPLTYGTVFTFKATTDITAGGTQLSQLCKLSTTALAVCYYVSATVTNAQVLSVSGTTITGNAEAAFGGSANIGYPTIGAFSATSIICGYTDLTAASVLNVQVGTISGTTITFGGSEYQVDATATPTRKCELAIISATRFAIFYLTNTTNAGMTIGSVATYVVSLGTPFAIGGTINGSFTTPVTNTMLHLTVGTSNRLTFSYLDYYSNRYVLGMAEYEGIEVQGRPLRFKIATASGGQLEISSAWIAFVGSGMSGTSGVKLFLGGTGKQHLLYQTYYGDVFHAIPLSNSSGAATAGSNNTIVMPLANNPIILNDGESLYATLNTYDIRSYPVANVFGMLRVVS